MFASMFRSLLGGSDNPTKVQEVKSDQYAPRQILCREDSLVLYEPSTSSKSDKQRYEIVLHRPFTESLDQAYSLYRSETQVDAEIKFVCFKDKIPVIVDIAKEMGNINSLQKLCNTLTEHPEWSLAHLAAFFALHDAFKHVAVNSQLNCTDQVTGMSPLQVAIKASNIKTVQLLVAAKCSLEHLDFKGNSVYHFAADTNKDIISCLVQGTTPRCLNSLNHDGYTPLHMACLADKRDCVHALLLAGADVNIEALQQNVPLSPSATSISSVPGYVGNFIQDNPSKLYAEDMKYGGTPLHWASSRAVIETLIDMNCKINAIDFHNRTALHVMVQRGRLDCVVALLSRQADPDYGDTEGNRPIHLAIQQGNISIIQSLVVFGASLDVLNNSGQSARHLAAQEPKLLYLLHAVGARRCSEDAIAGCTEGCRHEGTYNGEPPADVMKSTNRDILNQMLAVAAMEKAATSNSEAVGDGMRGKGGRVLCLDGGGIRGLVLIQMLLELEAVFERPINNCFDWISGTSTGGILALGIASGKTMKECLCLYFRMKEVTFVGMRPYASEALEKVLQETFGEETVMSEIKNPKVLVTGCLADRKPCELHLFRNYDSAMHLLGLESQSFNPNFDQPAPPEKQLLWQVGRASGAAPTYFKQFGQFLDGGLISNNPTMDTLAEIHEYNLALKAVHRECEIQPARVIVSLGTGLIPMSQMEEISPESIWQGLKMIKGISQLTNLLVDQATASDGRVVDRVRAWCSMIGVPYYRFSPQMSEDVSMDEKSDERLVRLLWETKAYMHSNLITLKELSAMIAE